MITLFSAQVPFHAPKLAPVAIVREPAEVVNPSIPLNDHPGSRIFEMAVWVGPRSPLEAVIRITVVCAFAAGMARATMELAKRNDFSFIMMIS